MLPPDAVGRSDVCSLQRRWAIRADLARGLIRLDRWAAGRIPTIRVRGLQLEWPGLTIISGHRSQVLQARLNPDAPNSLHTRCPALAVDLRVGAARASSIPLEIWSLLGQQWVRMGFRWGGDFSTPDPNHFDVGRGFSTILPERGVPSRSTVPLLSSFRVPQNSIPGVISGDSPPLTVPRPPTPPVRGGRELNGGSDLPEDRPLSDVRVPGRLVAVTPVSPIRFPAPRRSAIMRPQISIQRSTAGALGPAEPPIELAPPPSLISRAPAQLTRPRSVTRVRSVATVVPSRRIGREVPEMPRLLAGRQLDAEDPEE